MFNRAVLVFIMLLPLAGAIAANVALPVLVMMGGLIVVAFFAAGVSKNQQQ